jgi:hypothetical protein
MSNVQPSLEISPPLPLSASLHCARTLNWKGTLYLFNCVINRARTGKNSNLRAKEGLFSMGEIGAPRADLTALVKATIDQLRNKLLDLSLANRLLNFKPSEKSKAHILIVDEIPEQLFDKLENGKELEFAWIEEPEAEPPDERTLDFTETFKKAKATDPAHLERLEKLGKRPSRRQISNLERALRDRVRLSLGLSPRVKPSVAERARELGIDPSYELPSEVMNHPRLRSDSKIQTLLYRENMEIKLAVLARLCGRRH